MGWLNALMVRDDISAGNHLVALAPCTHLQSEVNIVTVSLISDHEASCCASVLSENSYFGRDLISTRTYKLFTPTSLRTASLLCSMKTRHIASRDACLHDLFCSTCMQNLPCSAVGCSPLLQGFWLCPAMLALFPALMRGAERPPPSKVTSANYSSVITETLAPITLMSQTSRWYLATKWGRRDAAPEASPVVPL